MNPQLKLKFYLDHCLSTLSAKPSPEFQKDFVLEVTKRFIDPLELDKQAKILNLDCGAGHFMEHMVDQGYNNVKGYTLVRADLEACQSKKLSVELKDTNLLPETDESCDLIFARTCLVQSPFPYITLLEYNRVLKPNGILYFEVPQPDCESQQELMRHNFSVMGFKMWNSLVERCGFQGQWHSYEFNLLPKDAPPLAEKYLIFVLKRKRSADIK